MEKMHKLVFLFCLPFVTCEVDPCMNGNYEILNDWERSVNNTQGDLCDFFLKETWYRPISLVGNAMPTECPVNGFKCGTAVPIWMNGSYPLPGETVDVVACASHYNGDCCFYSYDIQVKNCGEYNIFNLKKTEGCRQAYCFGTEVKCAEGETSDNGGFTPGCEFDPCHSINYKLLNGEIKRSSNYTLQSDDNAIEDSRLLSGWYRVESASGNDIVNESVSMEQCGTLYPLWMMGSIPEVSEKTVDRKVCRSNLTNTCAEMIDIQVRNCESYRTYHLKQLNVDKSAYCFGNLPVIELTAIQLTTSPTKENYERNQSDKENDLFKIGCVVMASCLFLILSVIVIKCVKKRTENRRAISFSNVQEKGKNDPPSYAETIQNKQNCLRQENHKMHSKDKLPMEVEGYTVEVWSSSTKFAEMHRK